MSTGLLSVSTKPLDHYPSVPAAREINDIVKQQHRTLQFYDVMQRGKRSHPPGLALSLLTPFPTTGESIDRSAWLFPPLPPDTIIDAWHDELNLMKLDLVEDIAVCNENDDYQLPLELQPVLQDDNLPNDERDGWIIYNDSGEDSDWDALDIKNLLDWDPDQDPEQDLFTDDVYAWVRRDEHETLRGTRPRFYTRLDIPNADRVMNLRGKEPDTSPITKKGASTLAPYLFIQEIPAKNGIPQVECDRQFAHMFYRYAYLQLHEHFRRVSCFRQDDPSLPRFLLVQEFTDLYDDYHLKKREAEYWWRKNGWEGVIPEFFGIRKAK
ncbi:MAG: hypothetical protein Q9221_007341 [Calogaya cf. arnoldii]